MSEMREEDISFADRANQYGNTVILWKGSPNYVKDVIGDEVYLFDLLSQKSHKAEFLFKDIKPPARRIGMVNVSCTAVYVTRTPIRKMQVGLSKASLLVQMLPWISDYSPDHLRERVMSLKFRPLGQAMSGMYPCISDAYELAKESAGCFAFDHQFAITAKGQIIYKTLVVGEVDKDISSEGIVFKPGYQHLINLLDENYEKTFRTS